jgi:type III restriction enzyme
MSFYEKPIVNSPYAYPGRHWELDADGQPTNNLIDSRRRSDLITPMPKAKKRKALKCPTVQVELELTADDEGLSTAEQKYDPTPIINELRGYVATWRALPNPQLVWRGKDAQDWTERMMLRARLDAARAMCGKSGRSA